MTQFFISNEYPFDGSYFLESPSQRDVYFLDVNTILADLNVTTITQLLMVNSLDLKVDRQSCSQLLSSLKYT